MARKARKRSIKRRLIDVSIQGILFIVTLFAVFKILIGHKSYLRDMALQIFPAKFVFPIGLLNFLILLVSACGLAYSLIVHRRQTASISLNMSIWLIYTSYSTMAFFKLFHDDPCSCISLVKGMDWLQSLIVNLILLLIAIVGLVVHFKERRNTDIISTAN